MEWRHRCETLALALLMLACGMVTSVLAQESWLRPVEWGSSPEFEALSRRLEATQAEIQALRSSIAAPDSAIPSTLRADSQPTAQENVTASSPEDVPQTLTAAPPAAAPSAPAYPTVKVSGAFQADAGAFHQDPSSLATFGRIQDGASFRRARLAANGSVAENFNYFFQMDFAFFGRPTFTDLWGELTELPLLGNFRIGQWKQPFSLEVVSSFRYTTFIERSLLFQTFTPFRHLGFGFFDHNEDQSMTWAVSAFRTGQDQFGGSISTDGGNGTAERITWLPYYDEPAEGRYYLHLGAAHWLNAPPNDIARFRTIPEFFIGEFAPGPVGTSGQAVPGAALGVPYFVDTGPVATQVYNVLGTEILFVNGPFSIQSEAMLAMVDQVTGPNLYFTGAYVQLGYFLTGEHRPYNRAAGAIDRVTPFENFFRLGTERGIATGSGAWELTARFSYVDLNDKNIHGGTVNDLSVGVNWFMNPYTKMVFNYIRASNNNPTIKWSDTSIYGVMAQVDF